MRQKPYYLKWKISLIRAYIEFFFSSNHNNESRIQFSIHSVIIFILFSCMRIFVSREPALSINRPFVAKLAWAPQNEEFSFTICGINFVFFTFFIIIILSSNALLPTHAHIYSPARASKVDYRYSRQPNNKKKKKNYRCKEADILRIFPWSWFWDSDYK